MQICVTRHLSYLPVVTVCMDGQLQSWWPHVTSSIIMMTACDVIDYDGRIIWRHQLWWPQYMTSSILITAYDIINYDDPMWRHLLWWSHMTSSIMMIACDVISHDSMDQSCGLAYQLAHPAVYIERRDTVLTWTCRKTASDHSCIPFRLDMS